jgi:phosphate/sulfate permease
MVGACVASTSMEMEWNTQGKGIFVEYFISPVTGVQRSL